MRGYSGGPAQKSPKDKIPLKAADKDIHIRYLPVNSTAIHQPCDQGLIGAIKARYKKVLLQRTFRTIDNWKDVRDRAANLKKVSGTRGLDDGHTPHLLDVATMVRGIWRELPAPIIIKSWIKAACLPEAHVRQLHELLPTSASASQQIPASASTSSTEPEQQADIQEDNAANSLQGLVHDFAHLNTMNLQEIRRQRPDISDSLICEERDSQTKDESSAQLAELLKQWLSIEDNAEVLNEIIGIELGGVDEKGLPVALREQGSTVDEHDPDGDTVTIEDIGKQTPNVAATLDIAQVQNAIETLWRYCDAHGIETTTPLAALKKHTRTGEMSLPGRKRQKQQTLTELFNFGMPKTT